MKESMEYEVVLERDVEETWRLVTDPEALSVWMLGSFEFEPTPGSTLSFEADGNVKRGEIIAVEPMRRFAWRWSDGVEASVVSIALSGDATASTIVITERLLPRSGWARPSIPPVEASVA